MRVKSLTEAPMIAATLLVATVACGAPVPKLPPVETRVSIVPNTRSLKVGDPLLALAVLQCGENDTIATREAFSFAWNALHFEVCEPNGKEYRTVGAAGQGLACGSSSTRLKNGERARCFGIIEPDEKGAPFGTAGKWKLRVRIQCAASDIVSEPVVIDVEERSAAGRRAIEACTTELRATYRLYGNADAKTLTTLKASLTHFEGSNTIPFVQLTELLTELRTVGTDKKLATALKAIDDYRVKLNAVERELLDLKAASSLSDRTPIATKAVVEVMKRITEPSYERDLLVRILESQRVQGEYRLKESK